MSKRQQKRILICTFVAIGSGIFSSYIGGQISLKVHSQKCQTQPWGLKTLCNAWVAPGAIWQGSTTGLLLGILLGGFVSSLATRKSEEKAIALSQPAAIADQKLTEAISLYADELELTPAQREALRRFLVLLVVKLSISNDTPGAEADTLSLDELQRLVAVAQQQSLSKQNITLAEIHQLLLK